MLYLAIDQHRDQLTMKLRNEKGDVIQKEQISTRHDDMNDFFDKLARQAGSHRGSMAIVEVCGFNHWLLEKLKEYQCNEIVVIQPDSYSNKKTDKRDANALGDRLEVNVHLELWKTYDKQILTVEMEIAKRSENNKEVAKIAAIPGITAMGAITLLSRIGDIRRFKNPDSLANDFGLTPGCHNTAGKQRIGGMTKAGSPAARQVLNFAVIHVVRKDTEMKAWPKKIKTRRGAKIAHAGYIDKTLCTNYSTIINHNHFLKYANFTQTQKQKKIRAIKKGCGRDFR